MKKLKPNSDGVVLLSGGNPQIAMGEGDAVVQSFIAAMPDWKQGIGRRVDALVTRAVPSLKKAVKWNSPFYGVEGMGFFLSFHCYGKFVRLSFFNGTSLKPPPPGPSKVKNVRYLDLYEAPPFDEAQLVRWVKQAAAIPGWEPSPAKQSAAAKTARKR